MNCVSARLQGQRRHNASIAGTVAVNSLVEVVGLRAPGGSEQLAVECLDAREDLGAFGDAQSCDLEGDRLVGVDVGGGHDVLTAVGSANEDFVVVDVACNEGL